MQKPVTFIFIGRSGCGKGTHTALLIEKFKQKNPEPIYYLESGENFRNFIKGESYSNILSKKIYESGALQPEFLAVWTWSHLLVENFKEGEHLILDGTPRKLREAHVLETALDFYNLENVYVIYLNISREESKKRLLVRGRFDDRDPKEVDKRLDWFDKDVLPTVEFYRNNPRYNFLDINGEQSIEDVHKELVGKLAL